MVRAFLRVLAERPDAHIPNVSSTGGFFPFPGQTIYGASQAGRLHIYVGPDAKLMSLAIKVAPRLAIRFGKDHKADRRTVVTAARD